MADIVYSKINWENEPSHNTPLSAQNLNKMDTAIDELVVKSNSLIPNPVSAPTEGLEKLEYDGTVYEVKGGHKILNDSGSILTQKDEMQFNGVYTHNASTITEVDIVREFQSKSAIEALTGEEAKGFQYLDDDVYDAFTASDIGFDNSDTSFTGTDVQEVLEEVDTDLGTKANKTDLGNFLYINRLRGGIKTITQLNAHTGMSYYNLTGEYLNAPEIQGYTFLGHFYIEVGGFSGLFAFFDDVNKTATRTNVNPFVYNASTSNISIGTNLAYGMISLYQKNV